MGVNKYPLTRNKLKSRRKPYSCEKCKSKVKSKRRQLRFVAFADAYLCERCHVEWNDLWQEKFGDCTVSYTEAMIFFRDFIKGKFKLIFLFR